MLVHGHSLDGTSHTTQLHVTRGILYGFASWLLNIYPRGPPSDACASSFFAQVLGRCCACAQILVTLVRFYFLVAEQVPGLT